MSTLDIKEIRNKARGKWFNILIANGVNQKFLCKRNCPCPMCGGKDRFRWDDKNGDGGGYCHQCEMKGDGFVLLGKWLNLSSRQDLPKLLKIISDTLGGDLDSFIKKKDISCEAARNKYIKQAAHTIWENSVPIKLYENGPVNKYFSMRGLDFPGSCESLRFHSSLEYREDMKVIGKFPALVGKVSDHDGKFLGIHRTFIDHSGTKAKVSQPKMVLGAISGGAVHLDKVTHILNVAEGIETALAVRELRRQPVWASISATNLEKLDIPNGVNEVHIWADLDQSGTGERAAHALARRLYYKKIEVIIHSPRGPIPTTAKSLDWLDILNRMKKLKEVSNVH